MATRLGDLRLVADGGALVGLYFPQHWHLDPDADFGEAVAVGADPLLASATEELTAYLEGTLTTFGTPVRTHGGQFVERVWALLRTIPYGTTVTYGELAGRLGDRRLARRVGQAVGANPVSVLIPCHRVVGSDGSLTGYAGGLDRKRALLALEASRSPVSGTLF